MKHKPFIFLPVMKKFLFLLAFMPLVLGGCEEEDDVTHIADTIIETLYINIENQGDTMLIGCVTPKQSVYKNATNGEIDMDIVSFMVNDTNSFVLDMSRMTICCSFGQYGNGVFYAPTQKGTNTISLQNELDTIILYNCSNVTKLEYIPNKNIIIHGGEKYNLHFSANGMSWFYGGDALGIGSEYRLYNNAVLAECKGFISVIKNITTP